MLYDILQTVTEVHPTLHRTNTSTFSNKSYGMEH